jgi:cytochrome c oxidase cbb3-type subunit 3
MSDQSTNEPQLTEHAYDGIEEYDNPLPNWWLATFFVTIIFAALYYIHYTVGGGLTQAQELERDLQSLPKVAAQDFNEADLEKLMAAGGIVEKGKAVYAGKCAACHGPDGQGLIGPNLTDKFWLHGHGKRADLMKVISEGVPDKGMPTWSTMISSDEILQVASFVHSLQGTKPANPKPPQGEEVRD